MWLFICLHTLGHISLLQHISQFINDVQVVDSGNDDEINSVTAGVVVVSGTDHVVDTGTEDVINSMNEGVLIL